MYRITTMPSKEHKAGRKLENLPSTEQVLAVLADLVVNRLTGYEDGMELENKLQSYRLTG